MLYTLRRRRRRKFNEKWCDNHDVDGDDDDNDDNVDGDEEDEEEEEEKGEGEGEQLTRKNLHLLHDRGNHFHL